MSQPLCTHAQYLTARAADPKLKPYFVSTTCSRLDSIYQRGSCWIYWKEWISSGSGRPNPDRELFFLPCLASGTVAVGTRLSTSFGHPLLPDVSRACLPTAWASWNIISSTAVCSSSPSLCSFLLKGRSFLPPQISAASLRAGMEMQSPRLHPDLCISTYRCLVNAWGAGVVTVGGAMGRDPSWPPWAGGSWAVCSVQHGPTEERLGSYIMWLSKVPPGGQEAEKPLFNSLNLEPNSPFPQRHKVLFTQFQ